jgi:hypothetical protein
MKKNILSTYDFQETQGFVSYATQQELEYPQSPADNTFDAFDRDFNAYTYDSVQPLLSPDMSPKMSMEAFLSGGEVVMTGNAKFSAPLVIDTNIPSLTVNLNGKSIVSEAFSESNGVITEGNSDSYPFWVKKGGNLVIEGDGEVKAKDATYSMAVWANGGNVEIHGGKYYNGGNGCDLIYVSNGSKVSIHGGEFHAVEKVGDVSGTNNKYSAINVKDRDRDFCEVLVYGGKFYGFNPQNNLSEGTDTNFVAPGYKSVEVETGVWEVMKDDE